MKKMKMKSKAKNKTDSKKLIAKYLLYLAFYLLSFVLFNLLISSILFIFGVSVQRWYVIVAGLLSVALTVFALHKKSFLNWKSLLIVVALPIVTVTGLTALNGEIYDTTWDGNDYHKLAIGLMMEGWNPLYESEAEFVNNRMAQPIDLGGLTFSWGDAYAKASYIFAANMGALTGNVESGKVLNDISVLVTIFMFLGILLYMGRSWVFALMFAAVVVTPTTIGAQFLTNYVDILVYLYMFLLLCLFFWFEYAKEYRNELLAMFIATLIILINVKFSAFAYAGILCAVYYGWYIYRYQKDKDFSKIFFKQFTLAAAIAVVVGVFVVGLSTYPRNTLVYGHPLYPLMGGDSKDIMTANQPAYFKDKGNLEKFLIATFSKMDNIAEASGKEAEWKSPFVIYESELSFYGYNDLRISGNGALFSGILILSLVIIALGAKDLYQKDKKLFIMMALPVAMMLGMILVMSEVWWARYFPQLHFIVFAALIILDLQKGKFARMVTYGMLLLVLLNNVTYDLMAVGRAYYFVVTTRAQEEAFKVANPADECRTLTLATTNFPGAFFNGRRDLGMYEHIEYKRLNELEGTQEQPYSVLIRSFLSGRCEK